MPSRMSFLPSAPCLLDTHMPYKGVCGKTYVVLSSSLTLRRNDITCLPLVQWLYCCKNHLLAYDCSRHPRWPPAEKVPSCLPGAEKAEASGNKILWGRGVAPPAWGMPAALQGVSTAGTEGKCPVLQSSSWTLSSYKLKSLNMNKVWEIHL